LNLIDELNSVPCLFKTGSCTQLVRVTIHISP